MLVVFVGEKDYKCTASSFTYGPCELHWTITICRVTNCKQCRESLQQPCSASSTHHTTHTHIHSRTIFFNVKNMKVSPPLMVNLFLFFFFCCVHLHVLSFSVLPPIPRVSWMHSVIDIGLTQQQRISRSRQRWQRPHPHRHRRPPHRRRCLRTLATWKNYKVYSIFPKR